LTAEELADLSKLAVLYLNERLVGIPNEGTKGPAKKTKKKGVASPLLDAIDGHV
jgi:hypothetical protein